MNMKWNDYVTIFLGIWLIFAPESSYYGSFPMTISDSVCGALIILFSFLQRRWMNVLIAVWLQFAPLIFWAPRVVAYSNDTLIGAALIAFSVIIPDMNKREEGPQIPPGMTHNPSDWSRRIPVAFFALFAFFISRYMASFQLGYVAQIWDPMFDHGKGTMEVITSEISRKFPISDAGLGSVAYFFEALLAIYGGTKRWHTMPWIVASFGFLVIPVGIVSIILIALQPLVVGHYCFWCLLTAFFMVCMIYLTYGEVLATLRFLRTEMKRGASFWPLFWKGSQIAIGNK